MHSLYFLCSTTEQHMKILVLQHQYDNFSTSGPLMRKISANWVTQGHKIFVARGINQTLPDADIGILHVDLTKIPEGYYHALQKYPVIINDAIHDISKDLFSVVIVSRDDNFEGEVIVKTKANYGGLLEYRIDSIENNRPPDTRKRIPWSDVKFLTVYPTFKSIAHVPNDVWQNKYLIVEKFLPEQTQDSLFHLRIWIFFGEKEIHYKNTSRSKIIKSSNIIRKEYLPIETVPEELRAIREKLKFDYGKFDYGIHNGKPVLYDVNKTPGSPQNNTRPSEQELANIQALSQGLYDFIK